MSEFYYKYRSLFEDGNDIPYTHLLNIYSKKDKSSNINVDLQQQFFKEAPSYQFEKPKLPSTLKTNFVSEESQAHYSHKPLNNENIYDLFYTEKKSIGQDFEPKNNLNQKETLNLNRPKSMKETYDSFKKENDKEFKNPQNSIRNVSNKRNLGMIGQQVLNHISPIPEDIPFNSKQNDEINNFEPIEKTKKLPQRILEESKNKNVYDNFNQRLEHLDKLKRKYDLQRNFDEKKQITRYSDPIYSYTDDHDKYKKALEKRVLASKNLGRKEKLRNLLKNEENF